MGKLRHAVFGKPRRRRETSPAEAVQESVAPLEYSVKIGDPELSYDQYNITVEVTYLRHTRKFIEWVEPRDTFDARLKASIQSTVNAMKRRDRQYEAAMEVKKRWSSSS